MSKSLLNNQSQRKRLFISLILVLLLIFMAYGYATRPLPSAHITDEVAVEKLLGELVHASTLEVPDKKLIEKYKNIVLTITVSGGLRPNNESSLEDGSRRFLLRDPTNRSSAWQIENGHQIKSFCYIMSQQPDGRRTVSKVFVATSQDTYERWRNAYLDAGSEVFFTKVSVSPVYIDLKEAMLYGSLILDFDDDNQFTPDVGYKDFIDCLWEYQMKRQLTELAQMILHDGGYEKASVNFEEFLEKHNSTLGLYGLRYNLKILNDIDGCSYRVYASSPDSDILVSYSSNDIEIIKNSFALIKEFDIKRKG